MNVGWRKRKFGLVSPFLLKEWMDSAGNSWLVFTHYNKYPSYTGLHFLWPALGNHSDQVELKERLSLTHEWMDLIRGWIWECYGKACEGFSTKLLSFSYLHQIFTSLPDFNILDVASMNITVYCGINHSVGSIQTQVRNVRGEKEKKKNDCLQAVCSLPLWNIH